MNTDQKSHSPFRFLSLVCVAVLLFAGHGAARAEEAELFAGYADIGPAAWEVMNSLPNAILEYTKSAETLWNKNDGKLTDQAKTWYDITTNFYDDWDQKLASAEKAAQQYMGSKWTGWPDDWKKWIAANRKYVQTFDGNFTRALMFHVNMRLDMKDMADQKANNDLRLAELSLAVERVSNMNDELAEIIDTGDFTKKKADAWIPSFEEELPKVTNAIAMLQTMSTDCNDFLKKLSERKDYRESGLFTQMNAISTFVQDNPLVPDTYTDVVARMTETATKDYEAYKKQVEDYKKTYAPLVDGKLFEKFAIFKGHAYSQIPGIVQTLIKNLKKMRDEM